MFAEEVGDLSWLPKYANKTWTTCAFQPCRIRGFYNLKSWLVTLVNLNLSLNPLWGCRSVLLASNNEDEEKTSDLY